MSELGDYWLDYHVDDCEFCSGGGDPGKCKRWQQELDRAELQFEHAYELAKETKWGL